MDVYEFLLDLSGNAGIPSQHKIQLKDVTRLMHQQLHHGRDITVQNHYHRGCFAIETGDHKTADVLKDFRLEITWQRKTYRVPLRPVNNKPQFWVKFWGTGRGRISQLPNSYFDDILTEAGFTIIRGTEKRFHPGTGYYTGERSARVTRGDRHADRKHEWHDHEGNVFQWRLEYQGQPFDCFKGCGIFHEDGKCKKMEEKKEKRAMAGQQKCFFASSSMLRLCSDTSVTRVDAVPGARVGHVANHISNDGDLFRQADVVAVHAGANMDYGSPEASKPYLEAQATELEKVVKPLVEAQKKVFFIDPVAGKIPQQADKADHWAMVRSRMRKSAKKTNSTWISLNDLDWIPEEDYHEDQHHYTESGTKKVMKKVRDKIKQDTGIDVLDGMELTSRPYSGIYRHYKFGCNRCTRLHENGPCPPHPEFDADASLSDTNSSLREDGASPFDGGSITEVISTDPVHGERRNSICREDSSAHASGTSSRGTTGRAAAAASFFTRTMSSSRERSVSASKRSRDDIEESPEKPTEKQKKAKGPGRPPKGHEPRSGK